jgi:hypothetical protein
MNDSYNIAKELVAYFDVTRGVGHTTAMLDGADRTENCLVVTHAKAAESLIKRTADQKEEVVTLGEIGQGALRGRNHPLVLDNAATRTLLSGLISTIVVLQKNNADMADRIRLAKTVLNTTFGPMGSQ